jgi:predicted fused transcriptional regulator/phosphomethylpyrimidine kinase
MTTEPTTTREWTWDAWEACGGTDYDRSDRVASLVGDEIREIYDDMRAALNIAFDDCYPDPSPDNEEEHSDRHVEWLEWYECELWYEG